MISTDSSPRSQLFATPYSLDPERQQSAGSTPFDIFGGDRTWIVQLIFHRVSLHFHLHFEISFSKLIEIVRRRLIFIITKQITYVLLFIISPRFHCRRLKKSWKSSFTYHHHFPTQTNNNDLFDSKWQTDRQTDGRRKKTKFGEGSLYREGGIPQ